MGSKNKGYKWGKNGVIEIWGRISERDVETQTWVQQKMTLFFTLAWEVTVVSSPLCNLIS